MLSLQTWYTKCVLLLSQNTYRHTLDTSQSESHLHHVLLPTKKRITVSCSLRDDFNGNVAMLMFINCVTVMSL